MTSAVPALALDHVSKSYVKPRNLVVKDLSVSIRQGEACFIGPSGCGKSILIKLLAGIDKPTSGTVTRPDLVGMVFQSYALLPWLTVEAKVAFAARMQGFDVSMVDRVTREYLRMVQAFAARYPRELSGGQRQRVGIARALAVESDVLLTDEPFSALDPVMTDELHDDVLRIWEQMRKTIVMVSHNFEKAIYLADRVCVMSEAESKTIVDVNLPRPRRQESEAFNLGVRKLRALLEGRARSAAADTAPPQGRG